MPLRSDSVGSVGEVVAHDVDARWLMAYSACVGALGPAYLGTDRVAEIVGHPLFPVCVEWPSARRGPGPASGIVPGEWTRGVHASHDLEVRRAVQPGDRLTTALVTESVAAGRTGARQVLRLETNDAAGEAVAVTRMGMVYRGVPLVEPSGGEVPPPPTAAPSGTPAPAPPVVERRRHELCIGPELAHTYTECAHIWNPIHTDAAVARRAGLHGPILHGTATLALALSAVLGLADAATAPPVRRVRARFVGMVALPNRLWVRELVPAGAPGADGGEDRTYRFDVVDGDGRTVLAAGLVGLEVP